MAVVYRFSAGDGVERHLCAAHADMPEPSETLCQALKRLSSAFLMTTSAAFATFSLTLNAALLQLGKRLPRPRTLRDANPERSQTDLLLEAHLNN